MRTQRFRRRLTAPERSAFIPPSTPISIRTAILINPGTLLPRMEKRFSAGYRQLLASLKRIEELRTWWELARAEQERRGPNSPRFADRTGDDLKLEIGYFWKTHLELEEALDQAPRAWQATWRPRLARLFSRYHALVTPKPL